MGSQARVDADSAAREVDRLHRDLGVERSTREQLQDQQALLKAELERAEFGENSAREHIAVALAIQSELEERASIYLAEAATARNAVQQTQKGNQTEIDQMDVFRGAVLRFSHLLRTYVDNWSRSIAEGLGGDGHEMEGGCGVPPRNTAGIIDEIGSLGQRQCAVELSRDASPEATEPTASPASNATVEDGNGEDTPQRQEEKVSPSAMLVRPWSLHVLGHEPDSTKEIVVCDDSVGQQEEKPQPKRRKVGKRK